MEQLPYIDEHALRIDASPEVVWGAVLRVVRRTFGGNGTVARLLGCDPAVGSVSFDGRPGQTLPGFRVVEAEVGQRLVLRGRHRFSDYELAVFLDGDRLRAQTRAAFPGLQGRLYRAAVIGTGAHRVLTRRLLGQVARRSGQ